MKQNKDSERQPVICLAYADELEAGDEIWVSDEGNIVPEHRARGMWVEVLGVLLPVDGSTVFAIHVEQLKVLLPGDRFRVLLDAYTTVPTMPHRMTREPAR